MEVSLNGFQNMPPFSNSSLLSDQSYVKKTYKSALLDLFVIFNNKSLNVCVIMCAILRPHIYGYFYSIAVPSSPPGSFSLTASSSTSIRASWQLPPADSQNGIITGFKLFYKKNDSAKPATMVPINSGAILTKEVTGLDKYTEYEFQVLAFTSVGDGPNSSVEVERTRQDGKICNK